MSEARRGRPPLPPDQRRSERVWIYLTREEANILLRDAVRQGLSVSDSLRVHLGLPIPSYAEDRAA